MLSDTLTYIANNDKMQQVVVIVQAALTMLGALFALCSKSKKGG